MIVVSPWSDFLRENAGLSREAFLEKYDSAPFLGFLGKELAEDTRVGHRTLAGMRSEDLSLPAPTGSFDLLAPIRKDANNPFQYMITLGRAENNDIEIKDRTVSKFHAYFRDLEGNLSLNDATSANGTWVNGVQVTPDLPHRLNMGDEISIGPEIKARLLRASEVFDALRGGDSEL